MTNSTSTDMNIEKTIDEENRYAVCFDSADLSGTVDITSQEVVVFSENENEKLTVRLGQDKGETTLTLNMNQESIFKGTLTELLIKLQAADALGAIRNYFVFPSGKPLHNL